MQTQPKKYFVIYYLLAFSATTNARSDDNDSRENWTLGEVVRIFQILNFKSVESLELNSR